MRIRNLWVFISAIAILVAMLSMMNLYFAQNEFKDETERLKLTHQNKEDGLERQLADLKDEVNKIKESLRESNDKPNNIAPEFDFDSDGESPKLYDIPEERQLTDKPRAKIDYKDITKRPLYDPEFQGDIDDLKSEQCSLHTIYRDYTKDPVQHIGRGTGPIDCPIPCVHGSLDIGGSGDPHSKGYDATMENTGNAVGNIRHISGNTHLYADVVMQYFSWAEYDFMQPPMEKSKDRVLAAFISNCGPQYRLNWLQELMDSGLSVHSYGSCKNNRAEPPRGGSNHAAKQKLVASYKFTFAFENSMTDDYVTEKLFQPLVAGSVPIYYGAPNAKKFAPDNHSVIFAQDFANAKELAEYLKYLNENDTAYNEYLKWKVDGPSQEWISLVDLSILHSECRFCIRSADIDRLTVGEVVTGPYVKENEEEMNKYKDNKDALMLKVRERGQFYLRRIHLVEYTLEELKSKIMSKYSDDTEKGEIVWIYELWDRNKVLIDSDLRVNQLQYGHELEIAFSRPGNKDRHDYYRWWKSKHNLQ